ncbi:NXPE family member 4-like [Ptychodera flava]|uniref:NXPE family member 4-like n=1 Tax=Ptychodera flava TaxID=63121 RepID=UPI00396A1946
MALKTTYCRLYVLITLGSMLLLIAVYHAVNIYQQMPATILAEPRTTFEVHNLNAVLEPYWNSTNGELGSMNVTDASRTLLTPISNLTVIHYGDVIKLRLDAKDINGRQRVHGGDFWKALLTNKNNGKCSVPGHVEDLGNGTYFVTFVAKCAGQSTIAIALTHTREAVRFLEREFLPLEDKTAWKGYFGTGAKSSHTMCVLHREGTWENKCEYRYKTGLGRSLLLCDKPPKQSCASLHHLVAAFPSQKAVDVASKQKALFERGPVRVAGTPMKIHIRDADQSTSIDQIPQCSSKSVEKTFHGHWFNGSWHPTNCKTQTLDIKKMKSCLRSKNIYLFGDSTLRQWFVDFCDVLKINATTIKWDTQYSNVERKEGKYTGKIRGYAIQEPNITVNFFFQSLAVTRSKYRLEDFTFPGDIIDDLVDCNHLIVVSPWAHYTFWTQEAFSEKLYYIKMALFRFKQRCPDSVVAVKGAHVREQSSWQYRIYNSDWLLHHLNLQLKETFDEEWIMFYDSWDLNLSYPGKIYIHMSPDVIREEIRLYLSYICPAELENVRTI